LLWAVAKVLLAVAKRLHVPAVAKGLLAVAKGLVLAVAKGLMVYFRHMKTISGLSIGSRTAGAPDIVSRDGIAGQESTKLKAFSDQSDYCKRSSIC